jgi:hypothetical protein
MIMATPKYTERQVPLKDLLVDQNNPRLSEKYDSQNDTIQSMIKLQGEKLVELAKHILKYGFNPTNLLLVSPSEDENNSMFDVLDGNRRVTTLKLLEKPELAKEHFSSSLYQQLVELSVIFKKEPITDIKCVIVNGKKDADAWIQLNHRGENKGAGSVEWDGQVAARYDAIRGDKSPALQILDFAKEHANLSSITQEKINNGKFPITTLERLISSPEIRNKLGIEIKNKIVHTQFPDTEVSKGLTKIFNDLGEEKRTVSTLKSIDQRKDYITSFSFEELPDPVKKKSESTLLDIKNLNREPEVVNTKSVITVNSDLDLDNNSASATPEKIVNKPNKSLAKTKNTNRPSLIPKKCTLVIQSPRINNIYHELKTIDINKYPNITSVMFRVFIELSVDYFIDKKFPDWNDHKKRHTGLAEKIGAVSTKLKEQNLFTVQEMKPITKAIGGQTIIASSVKNMHDYVHSRHSSPVASELIVAWDDLQNFVEKIWQTAEQA